MTSAYTLDLNETYEPTVEYYTVLEEQLEYISYMSNLYRDEFDRLQRRWGRIAKKRRHLPPAIALVAEQMHYLKEFTALSEDYKVLSPRKKEVEKILLEQGLLEEHTI
jgi:hypothetical protein